MEVKEPIRLPLMVECKLSKTYEPHLQNIFLFSIVSFIITFMEDYYSSICEVLERESFPNLSLPLPST
uniref:Ovule protein n=1 Tax=Parascaris univalens TaxID=6257 RepID=A0A915BMX5_PARUN